MGATLITIDQEDIDASVYSGCVAPYALYAWKSAGAWAAPLTRVAWFAKQQVPTCRWLALDDTSKHAWL
jgi:hypothetical protein